MNNAYSAACKHCNCKLRNHWHVHANTITFSESVLLQHVRKFTNFRMQFFVRKLFDGFILTFPKNRSLVTALFKVTVEAVLAHVQFATNEPFCKWCFPLQNFIPLLFPGDYLFCHPAPKSFRIVDGFIVQLFILIKAFYVSSFAKVWIWWEGSAFLQHGCDGGHDFLWEIAVSTVR